jgi:hypothetical protein
MREQYLELRKYIFECGKTGEQPIVSMDFFYAYYCGQFDSQPKSRPFMKKDMMGNIIFNHEGQVIWEQRDVEIIPPHIFSQQFGKLIMMGFSEILDFLDKKFHINWLEDKNGTKIKLVN